MNKKATLYDFLEAYGWAILVVLIAIGVLIFLVNNQDKPAETPINYTLLAEQECDKLQYNVGDIQTLNISLIKQVDYIFFSTFKNKSYYYQYNYNKRPTLIDYDLINEKILCRIPLRRVESFGKYSVYDEEVFTAYIQNWSII